MALVQSTRMTTPTTVAYAVERLTPELIGEVEPILHAYYGATEAHVGLPPYDFDWDTYATLDAVGSLLLATARDGGALVGVALYIVAQHPHHRTLRVADCDTLSVDMNCRGKGVGRGLVAFAAERLTERGVQRMSNRYRTCYSAPPLFPALGFALCEQTYVKDLG